MSRKPSCDWPSDDPLILRYHDEEWGVPIHDDRKIFEFFVLDAFQAGLSWRTVLHKREHLRKAFDNFNVKKISKYGEEEVTRLLSDEKIIRNKAKINATISNAGCFLKVQKEFGSFDNYIWRFTGGKPIKNKLKALSEMPASSKESDEMSRDLKSRGFKFVGTTICYSFMQAAGLINDHLVRCFRYQTI